MIGTLRLYSKGKLVKTRALFQSRCGCPIIPAKGDTINDGGNQFIVSDTRWDYDLESVTVVADEVFIP